MKHFFVTAACVFLTSAVSFGADAFPNSPESGMTPGALCNNPNQFRYPEHIAYCNRDVSTSTKRTIIATYDSRFGYRIGSMNRADFKIDHYIPLCMGGSNDVSNLWPQHKSVYGITDPLEQASCEKMAQGRLKQAEAIRIIKRAKADLGDAQYLLERVKNL